MISHKKNFRFCGDFKQTIKSIRRSNKKLKASYLVSEVVGYDLKSVERTTTIKENKGMGKGCMRTSSFNIRKLRIYGGNKAFQSY